MFLTREHSSWLSSRRPRSSTCATSSPSSWSMTCGASTSRSRSRTVASARTDSTGSAAAVGREGHAHHRALHVSRDDQAGGRWGYLPEAHCPPVAPFGQLYRGVNLQRGCDSSSHQDHTGGDSKHLTFRGHNVPHLPGDL